MKFIVDYLKEHKEYEHNCQGREFRLELFGPNILLTCKGNKYLIDQSGDSENIIQEILEANKIEIRFCEECGIPFDAGFMTDGGFWYCCENCFDQTMDKSYGKGKWRGTEEEGSCGGFYEFLNDDNEWEDTGIFYTEWY